MNEVLDKLKSIENKLDYICEYIEKVNSNDYKLNEDLKNLITNLIANLSINRIK